jgi:hypothetical protein
MLGLRGWQISLDPQTIAGREIGNLGNRQGFSAAGDFHVEVWAGKIKRRRVSVRRIRKREHGGENQQTILKHHGDSLRPFKDPDAEVRHVCKEYALAFQARGCARVLAM